MGFLDMFKSKPEREEQVKNDIADFFHIDINNLFQYSPTYSHSEENIAGKEVRHYKLRLKELELGVFYELKIIEVGENELNVSFIGRSSILTDELKEFINFCANCYGLDNSGYGRIENKDYLDVERKLFSRMWNKIWITNLATDNDNMEMVIYSLKKRL
ncbi:hypothetical protein [Bacteroides gallinarum]|uniref:hypothetical protein n=1 Tax=Bacteroides gallinarum TaxID=376806 RepID=UPI0003755796|nr:hypothetical protein [Bacteroides gallinarum]